MKFDSKSWFILSLLLLSGLIANAQLDPLSAQYYTNEYLGNPAMAGKEKGLRLNAGYRMLMSRMPGSPATQSLSGDYGFNKVGIGLNLYNDRAGLQRQTRMVGTFAYHLPLNDSERQLHFGLSMGFMNQRIESADINGDPNDVVVGDYNARETYFDGDFGVAYSDKHLSVQAAIPNLKHFLKRDVIKLADVATFYAALGYKFFISEGADGMLLEPKLAYRGIQGVKNIMDAGAQMSIANEQVFITALYHSTGSATFGLGLNYKKRYLISGVYTTETSDLVGYTNGNFELNLRLSIP